MTYINPVTREWIKGGVECIRESRSSRYHQFYLWTESEDSVDRIYYSVCYDPNQYKLKAGEEYVFVVDIIPPISKTGTTTYILKGLIKI